MRDLSVQELGFVYGAGCSPTPPSKSSKSKGSKGKGSMKFGKNSGSKGKTRGSKGKGSNKYGCGC